MYALVDLPPILFQYEKSLNAQKTQSRIISCLVGTMCKKKCARQNHCDKQPQNNCKDLCVQGKSISAFGFFCPTNNHIRSLIRFNADNR